MITAKSPLAERLQSRNPALSNPALGAAVPSFLTVLAVAAMVSGCEIFGSDPASRPPAPPGVSQPPEVTLEVQGEYVCAVHGKTCSEDEVIVYWHRGRVYYLCSEACRNDFLANPP